MCADEAGLECVGRWRALEALLRDCGQPKAVLVSEVVAGSTASVTFDEGCCTEVLQTATGRHQRLAAAFVPSCGVLCGQQDIECVRGYPKETPRTSTECVIYTL